MLGGICKVLGLCLTRDGVKGVHGGGAHEADRYVHEDGYRCRHKYSAGNGDGSVPEGSERLDRKANRKRRVFIPSPLMLRM